MVGRPCGQFHGCSTSNICRTTRVICAWSSAVPILMLFRQARLANMARIFGRRAIFPGAPRRLLPRPARLDRRTRSFARVGAMVSDRRLSAMRAAESVITTRILSIFDDVDVVITPGTAAGPSRIGAYQRRGAIATLALVSARVPFQAMFNVTGQPAAGVPGGRDAGGLPTSSQPRCTIHT